MNGPKGRVVERHLACLFSQESAGPSGWRAPAQHCLRSIKPLSDPRLGGRKDVTARQEDMAGDRIAAG
eukprot:1625427-Prymnesium_polylepis.2